MPILDLHEDDLINAAEAAPPVAPRKQDPSFSTWATVKGAAKAVPAAVSELAGSASDILGAYGGVSAAGGASAGGMFSTGTEAEKKQAADASKKLREQGPDYRSEAGASFRQVAKDYMPDAQTAHGAEVAVAEFARMATKAVIGGVVAGPLAGALAAGAEEGFTASDKLADQGVDVNTRTQVGLVTGVVTGLGFALPVAGKTVAKTLGLALAGGPASFVAQNAATREILQAADYTQLADQYDPFDPVGLTLSTLVPLGFGAVAMRGAAKRAAAGQPVPEVAPAAPEVVDAARVQLLREVTDSHRATPPEDFAGAQAHETAVGKAMDQLASGQRVEVAQIVEPVKPDTVEPMPENKAPGPQGDAQKGANKGNAVATFDAQAAFEKHAGAGDVDESTNINAKSNAFADMAEAEGYTVSDRGAKYFTITKSFGKDADGYDKTAIIKVRVSDHSNVNRGYHFGDHDINIAPDDGYDRDTFSDALRKIRSAYVNDDLDTVIPNDQSAPVSGGASASAQIAQRMAASLEPVRAELDALRAQVEQQDAAPVARSADDAAGTKPADEPAQPAAAASAPRFDIDALAKQAADFLSDGRAPGEIIGRMQAGGQTVAPELQNMLVGAAEFTRRLPELIDQFRALEAQNKGAPVHNLIADAVERMRAGQPVDAGPAKASPLQARLDAEIVGNPAALETRLPTAFDDAGNVTDSVTVREFLDTIKAEAEQEAADADLLQVAANCFLMNGV